MNKSENAKVQKLMGIAIQKGASDLHLAVGVPPTLRIDGKLMAIANESILDNTQAIGLIEALMSAEQVEKVKQRKELDFSFGYQQTRFRVNVYYQMGNLTASLRLIPTKIKSLKELGLPPILEKFALPSQGFVIITGPTGHGKSTTLAALIDYISDNRSEHIITIEDPIEYVFQQKKSIISQRELGNDTNSFVRALRSALREDPNVILVGEMRDLETIDAALTLSETGHLVFTTLHTNNASQTTDRIIDVFPPYQQQQVRMQLANVLLGVVSQRLIPKVNGGRVAACEIMIANSAVRSLIREGKTHQLPNIIQTSASEGMISLDKVLAELVNKGDITIDDALTWCIDPKAFKMMVY
ncbi:MAG: type IV pili twitching motility protein PilT [Candidatus Nealsonbacteria bacterium CG23_combo_of_CG06-09_8_20_14_all_40_13]|uniref:Type IV pili twitching motility protein PilT n=1 Tax=Candidatus Nealsonbacteria bacterium CG23_combo_of_CG06-09_8_20_14_all_40_13 TaxID=1974724 RepID=A0A2G9YRQ3_9BACT|nr:MAG: type IV pili twitching motility protein PilT [Candidatus Nealsonbacteria bacterium CG23_combo_of_CG06-09_8_20_14_all_40_13]PIR71089.1 MAG: type IV pili twitching motility protein PilT [Candidatus Nealsonbacteria bacterium CG10_big_fil_rev_8_21_14_0_10_40_24]PIU42993.1 MAG: type IV pili twitching motility protein PilT [Candidatus Nealsonbacteria bacterium CG07_land_8_20_14_0_80_40_10]